MALNYTIAGLSESASEKIISILQSRLSQEQDAALILKHAHWNVSGPNFIGVHEMIDPQVDVVLNQADETAAQMVVQMLLCATAIGLSLTSLAQTPLKHILRL